MRVDTDETIQKVLRAYGIDISRSIDSQEYILTYNGKESRLSDLDVYLAKDKVALMDLIETKVRELKSED